MEDVEMEIDEQEASVDSRKENKSGLSSTLENFQVATKRRNAVVRNVKTKPSKGRKSKKPSALLNEEDRPLKVGTKIFYWENKILGQGGTATVYKGYFEVPSVQAAIKVLKKENFKYYENEVETLRQILARDEDNLQHIVRYFATEEDEKETIFYLAVEMCDLTLHQYFESKPNPPTTDLIRYCKEICLGLQVLHCAKRRFPIVHRDLKPSNILLKKVSDGSFIAKLTDFGISKILENLESSTTSAEGTIDWMSPTCLQALNNGEEVKVSLTDDIFSLGMLIFYIMTQGCHPFGQRVMRAANIIHGKVTYQPLQTPEGFIALTLVHSMLQGNAKDRPTISTILEHPLFWTKSEILNYITTSSNNLAHKKHNTTEQIDTFNNCFKSICQCSLGWMEHFCDPIKLLVTSRNLAKPNSKKYSAKSAKSLLEFIRDKWQHKSEWPDELKTIECFGKSAKSYINYFTAQFPMLLPVLFLPLQENYEAIKHFKLNDTIDWARNKNCKILAVPAQNGNHNPVGSGPKKPLSQEMADNYQRSFM